MKHISLQTPCRRYICYFPSFLKKWGKAGRNISTISALIMVLCTGCFQHYFRSNTKNSANEAVVKPLVNSNKYFIIHFSDFKALGLNNAAVTENKIEGDLVKLPVKHEKYLDANAEKANLVKLRDKKTALTEVHLYTIDSTTGNNRLSLGLSSIDRMDVYSFDKKATRNSRVLSIVGIVTGGLAIIVSLAAVGSSVGNSFGSGGINLNCPQVYIKNNDRYEFKSGVYVGAVYSTLERSDFLPLEGIQPVNNKYQFRIGNVENEEQYINQVQLMKVDHPADIKLLADRHGKILSYKDLELPVKAVYNDNVDVTRELKFSDAQYYSFNSQANDNGFSSVVISFNKPSTANKGKLLIHAGNSKWAGYIYKEYASSFGNTYEKWRKRQEQITSVNAQQSQLDQGLPIKVFVESEKGWQYVDHFALTGNTASRDMIMELDLATVKTDKVNIKLESIFRFWDVDMVATDFSTDQMFATTILDPVSVAKSDGTINLGELSHLDKEYTHLTGKDFVNISFDALPATNGMSSSFFLLSNGYYHSLQKFQGRPDRHFLVQFREKSGFDRFSRNKYVMVKKSLGKSIIKEPANLR